MAANLDKELQVCKTIKKEIEDSNEVEKKDEICITSVKQEPSYLESISTVFVTCDFEDEKSELNQCMLIKQETQDTSEVEYDDDDDLVTNEQNIIHVKRDLKDKKSDGRPSTSRDLIRNDHLKGRHFGFHHGECDYCAEESNISKPQQSCIKETIFTCNVCCKTFAKKENLKRHVLMHNEDRPFKCHICERAFKIKQYLTQHILLHSNERRFSCSICNKAFTQKAGLVQHKLTHTLVKPFFCKICNKAFAQTQGLAQHFLTHTMAKSFSCTKCKKSFTTKAYLRNHVNRCHSK